MRLQSAALWPPNLPHLKHLREGERVVLGCTAFTFTETQNGQWTPNWAGTKIIPGAIGDFRVSCCANCALLDLKMQARPGPLLARYWPGSGEDQVRTRPGSCSSLARPG